MNTDNYNNDNNKASLFGLLLTIIVHIAIFLFLFYTGIIYVNKEQNNNSYVINYQEATPIKIHKNVKSLSGKEAESKIINKKKHIALVQKSEAPIKGKKPNKTAPAKVDKFGDVEIKQPKQKEKIDKRALFPSAKNIANKDSLAPQTAEKVSDALKAGHPLGNIKKSNLDGRPNAHLKGRTVIGSLPIPKYTAQESGKVVVTIWVNQYGKVTRAVPGGQGTTVLDNVLWKAAKEAALKAHFNLSASAPISQTGTITYIFKLQ